jgi:hypothetical protein
MPKGMYLRSACDWHLDTTGVHTIEKFLQSQGKTSCDVEPLSLDFYLSYVAGERRELKVELNNGETLFVDQIILATGYKVNIAQLPILASGNILPELKTRNGFPDLDDHFQTSIPGLFITSMPASQDFGPFFGFTVAVRAAAQLICASF